MVYLLKIQRRLGNFRWKECILQIHFIEYHRIFLFQPSQNSLIYNIDRVIKRSSRAMNE